MSESPRNRPNQPTVSEPSVMATYHAVRSAERDTLLDYVGIEPGMRVLDVQSAGGYLSDEIKLRHGGGVCCYCLEPNDALRSRLDPAFIAVGDALEHFASIDSGSMDVVLGLVALHHSNDHERTLAEIFRVLRPGGEVAICEVEEGSNIAAWLNGYVDANSASGHQGNFVRRGELAGQLTCLGFRDVREEVRSVPWVFPSRRDVGLFFKGLFGLQSTLQDIDTHVDRFFSSTEVGGRTVVDWHLIYGHARKPDTGDSVGTSSG